MHKQCRLFVGLALLSACLLSFSTAIAADRSENYAPEPAPSPAQAAPAAPVVTAVPVTVAFQGYLTDAAGNPITANVTLDLAIFNVPAAGVALWSETQAGVVVSRGVFQVALGSVAAFPPALFTGTPRYLAIRVNGGPELVPRTQLRSTPYALQSGNADLVGGEAGPFVNVSGDAMSGPLELDGGVVGLQLGGMTEVVASTSDVLLRRYFLDTGTGTQTWSTVNGRMILAFNGVGTPNGGGSGVATVTVGLSTIATIIIPSGGFRPWTYAVALDLLDIGTVDVAVRADAAGSPVNVRSITLETQADRNPWVIADLNGTTLRQSGGFTVSRLSAGRYLVDHPDINESAVSVVASSFNRPGGGTSPCAITVWANAATGFNVEVYDLAGVHIDHDFSLMATTTTSPAALRGPSGIWNDHNE